MVLGKIYRAISCKEYYDACIYAEHKYSVLLDYRLTRAIIGDKDLKFHALLIPVFKRIVVPMEDCLKEMMVEYMIANESELFCSDLSYRFNDEVGSKYIGDPSKKAEDAIQNIN